MKVIVSPKWRWSFNLLSL